MSGLYSWECLLSVMSPEAGSQVSESEGAVTFPVLD